MNSKPLVLFQSNRQRKRVHYGGAIIVYSTNRLTANEIMQFKHTIKKLEAAECRKKRTLLKMQKLGRFVKEFNSNDD